MLSGGLRVKYLFEPVVYKRAGNDSFLDQGLVNRCRISIDGYNAIADKFFGWQSMEAFHIRRILRNEWTLKNMLYAKSECRKKHEAEDRKMLNRLASSLYSDPILINRFNMLIYRLSPVFALKIAKSLFIFMGLLPRKAT